MHHGAGAQVGANVEEGTLGGRVAVAVPTGGRRILPDGDRQVQSVGIGSAAAAGNGAAPAEGERAVERSDRVTGSYYFYAVL